MICNLRKVYFYLQLIPCITLHNIILSSSCRVPTAKLSMTLVKLLGLPLSALLIYTTAVVNAQIKCNDVSIDVTDGWCKGKTVAYKGCFDATNSSSPFSKAAFIALNQANFKPFTKDICLTGAISLCANVGGAPRAWDCTDVNNECKADNLANNQGVGACTTDAQCTGFAKSTFNICCSSMTGWATDLICQNTAKAIVSGYFVPPICSNDKDCRVAGATSTRAMIYLSSFGAAVVLAIVAVHSM